MAGSGQMLLLVPVALERTAMGGRAFPDGLGPVHSGISLTELIAL